METDRTRAPKMIIWTKYFMTEIQWPHQLFTLFLVCICSQRGPAQLYLCDKVESELEKPNKPKVMLKLHHFKRRARDSLGFHGDCFKCNKLNLVEPTV